MRFAQFFVVKDEQFRYETFLSSVLVSIRPCSLYFNFGCHLAMVVGNAAPNMDTDVEGDLGALDHASAKAPFDTDDSDAENGLSAWHDWLEEKRVSVNKLIVDISEQQMLITEHVRFIETYDESKLSLEVVRGSTFGEIYQELEELSKQAVQYREDNLVAAVKFFNRAEIDDQRRRLQLYIRYLSSRTKFLFGKLEDAKVPLRAFIQDLKSATSVQAGAHSYEAPTRQKKPIDFSVDEADVSPVMVDPVSREEHDAKIALMKAETRIEAVRQEGKLDLIQSQLNGIAANIAEDRRLLQSSRTTILATVVSTGIGIVAALAALYVGINQSNQASQANMLSAFQAGLTALTAKLADK